MKIAIDARILVRSRARRTLLGAAELCESQVVVPETALAMAKLHYPTMSAKYVRKTLQWDDVMAGKRTSDEAMGLRVHDATQTLGIGFARWLDEEIRRHDGVFTEAPQTRRGQGVAMELSGAGVVEEPRDGRWGVGGGPYVIAEALEAGAHWVASDNFLTLESGLMELWLDEAQARGRYAHVPRPFVLTAEQVLRKMIERSAQWPAARHQSVRRAVVHAVSAPRDTRRALDERMAIFQRFAKELEECGMTLTAGETDQWALRMKAEHMRGNTARVAHELEDLAKLVPVERVKRTRESEARRMKVEGLGEAGAGTTTGYAEGGEHWRHEALSAAVRDEDLALFLWTWEERHGDPIELAQRVGLMATRNAQGGLYKQ